MTYGEFCAGSEFRYGNSSNIYQFFPGLSLIDKEMIGTIRKNGRYYCNVRKGDNPITVKVYHSFFEHTVIVKINLQSCKKIES